MLKKNRKKIAFLLSLCMLLSCFGFTEMTAAAYEASGAWEITLHNIELETALSTTDYATNYDGSVTTLVYDDKPADGNIYAVVSLTVESRGQGDALDFANVKLHAGQATFDRVADDSFLENHQYSTIAQNAQILVTTNGSICFELPEEYLNEPTQGWFVSCDSVESAPYGSEDMDLPVETTIIDQQKALEQRFLTDYQNKSDHSLEKANIILNPYGTAPLSALLMFETENACNVQVTVHGQNGSEDFSYTLADKDTYHEVSIIGLYPDSVNKVTVSANGQSKSFQIATEGLPSDFPSVSVEDLSGTTLTNGLIYISGLYRYCFDTQGNVRWYSNIKQDEVDSSCVDNVSAENGIWYATLGIHKLYHMSWLGKILHQVELMGENMHHDGTYTDDGKFLYFHGNTVASLDLETGEVEQYLDLSDIADPEIGSLELRETYAGDWIHANTIYYQDGFLYFSFRNQHMLMKYNYTSHEVEWVLTPAYTTDEDGNVTAVQSTLTKYLILPDENDPNFEWFYSQHHITLLPDLDNNPNTEDITIFDNNLMRGVKGIDTAVPQNEWYSRMVHYRINLQTKRVEQIFDWGEEAPFNSGCEKYGSTQWIAPQETYLGGFDTRVVEVNSDGQLLGQWQLGSSFYRAHYISSEEFGNIKSFIEEDAVSAQIDNNHEWMEWEPAAENEELRYDISKLVYRSDNVLAMTGWAYIPGEQNSWRGIYLVLRSDAGSYYTQCVQSINPLPEEEREEGGNWNTVNDPFIPLEGIPDGEYTVGLQVLIGNNGKIAYVDLPYRLKLGEYDSIPKDDILQSQTSISHTLLSSLSRGSYSFDNPYVVVNPYNIAPLSAVAVFTTEKPASISIEVEGKDGAETVKKSFETVSTEHYIPVYGLYEGETTDVKLTAHYQDGRTDTKTLHIAGENLPEDFVPVSVDKADTTQMAEGWTFLMAGSLQGYVYAIDETGAVRWMFSEKGLGAASAFLPLENGNYLIGGDKSFGNYYKNNLFEIDLTGRIVKEYLVDGYHHDAQELSNGNLLVLANNVDGSVVEDTIYEIDRGTGSILHTWDLNGYFNVGNYNESGEHVSDINYGASSQDWLHANGINYNEETNTVLISSRHQDAVFSMNLSTGEINWILSDPNDEWPEYLAEKLLTPTNDEFEWQYGQHNAIWLPDGDIMMFDNGDYRSKNKEDILDAATQSYSRAVIYHIDEENMTVSQQWQFGKEFGPDSFAVNVSGVQYLGEDHYLIDFGGIVKNSKGEATYNIMDGITGSSQSQIYEVKNGEIIFHAAVKCSGLYGNTYRAIRLMPYSCSEEPQLKVDGKRLGSLYRYGLAETITFNADEALSNGPDVEVLDNGVQLNFTSALDGNEVKCDLALVFAGEQSAYKITLPSGTKIAYTLNHSEIPIGQYELYLVKDGVTYDLNLKWENSSSYRAFPVGYRIDLTAEQPEMGSVYGSGTYYADTPFTIYAVAKDGYQFVGWYCNGKKISTDETYTMTATSDTMVSAKFSIYQDVTEQDWYYEAVGYVKNNNIMQGYSAALFAPLNALSRAQACQILYNIADVSDVVTENGFDDVGSGMWYTDAIGWAAAQNIVSGYGDGTFGPDDSITREQMAVILYRYAGLPNVSSEALKNYTDAEQISPWAYQALSWCVENDIMVGNGDGTIAPATTIIRAEAAAMLMRYVGIEG